MENYNLIDTSGKGLFGEIFPHVENILHCGWYTHNLETNEMFWSKGTYVILGLEVNSLPAHLENLYKFINPEYREFVSSGISQSKHQKKSYQLEFSITDGQGLHKRLYIENYISPANTGEVFEYSGVIKDITESYYYKKALEQKITQLDKSNQNLQEFVYVASHDLQEPLRKISTFSERLNNKFSEQLGQEGAMYVKRIMSSKGNMKTLLEDLLSFSRLSFNDRKFEKVMLNDSIDEVLSDLEIKIEDAKATVTRDDCPTIEAFPSQIKQLFNNLIGNALKFKRHDAPLQIKIKCSEAKLADYPLLPLAKDMRYIALRIEDNGIGFEQEFSERIFMIFQRLNGKSEYAGSGVGLAICKKIADNHHGFIFAQGQLDRGATFTILLPEQQS